MPERAVADFRQHDEIPMAPLSLAHGGSLRILACTLCGALIIDDHEHANRALHEQWHRNTIEALRALRDGKADAL